MATNIPPPPPIITDIYRDLEYAILPPIDEDYVLITQLADSENSIKKIRFKDLIPAVNASFNTHPGDMLTKNGYVMSVNLAPLSGLGSTTPGLVGGQLKIIPDNETIVLDALSGSLKGLKDYKYIHTLTGADYTNGYIDLPNVAFMNSVDFKVLGGPPLSENIDYKVEYTNGLNNTTRIIWINDLTITGKSPLVIKDMVEVIYRGV